MPAVLKYGQTSLSKFKSAALNSQSVSFRDQSWFSQRCAPVMALLLVVDSLVWLPRVSGGFTADLQTQFADPTTTTTNPRQCLLQRSPAHFYGYAQLSRWFPVLPWPSSFLPSRSGS